MSQTTPTRGPDSLSLESGVEALRSSPEFTGAVESMDGPYCNDHFALLYETQAERLQAIVPFLRQGIERGERCMYVIDELSEETLLGALRDGGVDVDQVIESGQLTIHTVDETYLRNGMFDPDEMIDFYEDTVETAAAEYSAFRVVAETTWLEREEVSIEAFMEYESKINDLFDGNDCIALCQYDRTGFDPDVVKTILQTHPHLIFDGTVCNNVYYTPPEEYFAPDEPAREVDRMMQTLLDRTEARVTLEDRQRVQQRLHEITSDPDSSFEEKLQDLFTLGLEAFEMELGAIARIDPETDKFEVEWTSSDHARIGSGTSMELSETYCRLVTDGGTAAVSDPERQGFGESPVYRELGIQSYVGTHLSLESGEDRTFFFISSEERVTPVTDAERTFHRLMGQWIEQELERQQRNRYLRELYEITADSEGSFETKIERVLELGRERFGLDQGYLTQYNPDEEIFENQHVVGPSDEPLRCGVPDAQPKPGQFCRATVAAAEPMGAPNVRDLGWEDDPVYEESGLRSYFGIRVSDGTGPYGTLAFCDPSVRDRPYTEAEDTFLELMGQWVSHELEQRRRESQLAALNDMSRDLMDAPSFDEIAAVGVDHAHTSLNLPLTAIVTYDQKTGTLSPMAETPGAREKLSLETLTEAPDGPAWNAFISTKPKVVDATTDQYHRRGVTEIAAVGLEQQGVLITATTRPDGFEPIEWDLIETMAATIEGASTRADREHQLQSREETLEEQNATLERLNRINTTIRSIDQTLVQSSTRKEIEGAVCEQLASVGPYELAWVGSQDAVTGSVVPREVEGIEEGYLKEVTEEEAEHSPARLALSTREPQVVNNVLNDQSFEPWRQAALNRGYHACIALPLVYEGTCYGLLSIYAGQPDVFNELEQAVLAEMADTIAYAINAVESKRAVISDERTELEFSIDDMGLGIMDLVRTTGCEFSLESLIPRSDGRLRGFFSTRGVNSEAVVEFATCLPITDLMTVSEELVDDTRVCLFEATLDSGSLAESVVNHGAQLQAIDATEDGAEVTVHLGEDAEIRTFVEMLKSRYSGVTLIAQRSRQREQANSRSIRAVELEELTARQLEVLQTAYFNGYFEEPRNRTASQIAETLDISQPTFNGHTRAAERKLLAQLFDRDGFQG